LFPLVLLAGCAFDGGGVAVTGDDAIDADPGAIDADPTVPDAEALDALPGPRDAPPIDDDDDDDGVVDDDDNCPVVPNPTQHDEDADTLGDACDNCPAVANLTQANTTESVLVIGDLVGDACDPHPTTAEVITLFEPFDGVGLPEGWTVDGGSWTVSLDALHQGLTTSGSHVLYYAGSTFKDATLVTRLGLDVVVLNPNGSSDIHSVGVLTRYAANDKVGYLCNLLDDATTMTDTQLRLGRYSDGTATGLDLDQLDTDLAAGQTFGMIAVAVGEGVACRANAFSTTATDATHTDGFIALRSNAVAATFPYVMVVQPP